MPGKVLALYRADLEAGRLEPDPEQARVVERLDAISAELSRRKRWQRPSRSLFARWLGGATDDVRGVRGLYLWGGVGRGKTHLCDLFFDALDFDDKVRLHFHSFMRRVHANLRELGEVEDPLERVADDWATRARLLLLDEMHVNDITDAMLLGGLLGALYRRGVTLVTTSNVPPDGLYRDGLQRARFLPATAQMKRHCDVLEMPDGEDYRQGVLRGQPTWIVGDAAGRKASLDALVERLAGRAVGAREGAGSGVYYSGRALELGGRELPVRACGGGLLRTDFRALCEAPRSTGDYIEIAERFPVVVIDDVPTMGADDDDAARRFVNLVDEFYDRGVRLVASAEAEPGALYDGDRLAFEFTRATSRLLEMQGEGWGSRRRARD